MPDNPCRDTDLGPTAKEPPKVERALTAHLIYVLCYDDLRQGDSAVVASLTDACVKLVVGRGSKRQVRDGMLRLTDKYVARSQAVLEMGADGWHLKNLSERGTWVNGESVGETVLQDGDMIEVGHTLLVFRWVSSGEAKSLEPDQPDVVLGPTRTLCPEVRQLARHLARVAATSTPVLLLGETGTGKEVVAKFIHDKSGRRKLTAVNCAAIPPSLFEDTLFGHVPKAYTDAKEARKGVLLSSENGTVFLDEIGDVQEEMQAKLLRVLEEGLLYQVGSDRAIPIDIRFLAATNVDVRTAASGFRSDLLARLGSFLAELPPLRMRREDLGILIAHALAGRSESPVMIETEAARELFFGPFPGNIRSLVKAIQIAAFLASPDPIERPHLARAFPLPPLRPVAPRSSESSPPADEASEDQARPTKETLLEILERCGTQANAARVLGVTDRTIRRWLALHGVDTPGRSTAVAARQEPRPRKAR